MTYKTFFVSLILLTSPNQIRTLYNSLDPLSLSQHLAFYELYPQSTEGQKALMDMKNLMGDFNGFPDLRPALRGMVALVNKAEEGEIPLLSEGELQVMERIGRSLHNRRLKGHTAVTEEEVLSLPSEEVDLARGLFLSEMGPDNMQKIRSYEAYLDLMAIQIRARLPHNATLHHKVEAMNHFIFYEMGFRFPPHSLYAKDIDLYTFLPSVLDSRRGVCLGVSILYIALAQRLELPLEMVTPPGHIYVRVRDGNNLINIETTARGIHLDSEVYLGVDTRALKTRNVKEVIGLAHFNQASLFWQKMDPQKALQTYTKALPYMQDDPLLKELMGYNYLFTGQIEKGRACLREICNLIPDEIVSLNPVPVDYLNGSIDVEGLKTLFQPVDENRSSITLKKNQLEALMQKYPLFRAGWFQLGVTYLQLNRTKEAVQALKQYHALFQDDATAEYYLSALYLERLDYPQAWIHLRQAEKLTTARNHFPKALKDLRHELSLLYPEYTQMNSKVDF